jgi:acyl-CoA thioesterase
MSRFGTDTALTEIKPGIYEGRIDPAWRIIRGANGGHIAAIMLRGMVMAVDETERAPRSLTVHFARVPKEAPFRIDTSVERKGRTTSTLTAHMTQEKKLVAFAVSTFSLPQSGPEFADLPMPEVPSPDDIDAVHDREDFPFGHHFDFRPALGPRLPDTPQEMVATSFELSDRAELALWIRLREPQLVDHIVATQFLDAFAPAVFVKLGAGAGGAGVPTIEMTTYFREELPLAEARPDDWYLGVFRTTLARGGFIEEDGWLWSRDGRLVAQSRQLALLMSRD